MIKYLMTIGTKKLLQCLNNSFLAKAIKTRKVSFYMKSATYSSFSVEFQHQVQSSLHQMLLIVKEIIPLMEFHCSTDQ